MNPKFILVFSSVYLVLVGLGLLLAPTYTFLGLDEGAAPVVVAQLRAFSDIFLGVAVLNWMARNAEASKARDAIFLGNTVGFGLSAILGTNVSIAGGQMISWIFTAVSLFCAVGFVLAGMKNMSSKA